MKNKLNPKTEKLEREQTEDGSGRWWFQWKSGSGFSWLHSLVTMLGGWRWAFRRLRFGEHVECRRILRRISNTVQLTKLRTSPRWVRDGAGQLRLFEDATNWSLVSFYPFVMREIAPAGWDIFSRLEWSQYVLLPLRLRSSGKDSMIILCLTVSPSGSSRMGRTFAPSEQW